VLELLAPGVDQQTLEKSVKLARVKTLWQSGCWQSVVWTRSVWCTLADVNAPCQVNVKVKVINQKEPGQIYHGRCELDSQGLGERPDPFIQINGDGVANTCQLIEIDLQNGRYYLPMDFGYWRNSIGVQLLDLKEAVEKVDGCGSIV
jgi:hypothetical protein